MSTETQRKRQMKEREDNQSVRKWYLKVFRKTDNTGKKETEGKTKAMFTPQRRDI